MLFVQEDSLVDVILVVLVLNSQLQSDDEEVRWHTLSS